MKTVLVIGSSLFGPDSQSSRLAAELVTQLQARHGDLRVVNRDLALDPVPHLDADTFAAFGTPEEQRSAGQRAAVSLSDQLIGELQQADFIVLAAPMYNFGLPSTFKAWFDHVARAGITFAYTQDGVRGLLKDLPVFIIATRGGLHAGTANDLQSPYLRQILGFVGLTDLHFIYAEGMAMSDYREQSLAQASLEIQAIAA
jgi:FMN-dependent NADH-azoreductase